MGRDYIDLLRRTQLVLNRLERNNFNFSKAKQIYARQASADVLAKEIVHIFDGKQITRVGRLITIGVGDAFNLMGPIPANSEFRVTGDMTLVNNLQKQFKDEGLANMPAVKAYGEPQKVEFFNYGFFFDLRELLQWFLLHNAGCFPSTLEHMKRLFAAGNVIQNNLYEPPKPSHDMTRPAIMQIDGLTISFPATAMEWMDKPLYGGLAKETHHIEYLLTPTKTNISHPYLPFDGEQEVVIDGKKYFAKRYKGSSPKDGIRNDKVPPELPEKRNWLEFITSLFQR